MCDGRVVTAVTGFFLSAEHIVEFQLARARAQHEEALPCGECTTHEAALVLLSLSEHRDGPKPKESTTLTHEHE